MLDYFQTAMMFKAKQPKLILTFTIVEFGEHHGKRIRCFFNVQRVIGKPQKGGRFQVTRKQDFYREYQLLFNRTNNARLDRLPMSEFHGVTILAQVETVKRARGVELVGGAQYSVIRRLLKVVEK